MSVQLFEPLMIRNVRLKNRLAVSPMCQYSSNDGYANDWHLVHLGSRAVGGVGLILTEATAVSPEGRISPRDLGIWKDEHISMLKRITDFISRQGAVAGIQLAHAGRKASHDVPWNGNAQLSPDEGGWSTMAPSPLPFTESDIPPMEMTSADIEQLTADFRAAALRAVQAGFQVIEVHAAHGYLIHEFLSPLSNHRTDQYGGSFENRIKLLKKITAAIRESWPDEFPLFLRISATDWKQGGWTIENSVALAQESRSWGIDLIDCSSGGNIPKAEIPIGPMYQVSFADQVKKTGMLTGAVGMINSATEAETILQEGKADLILMARQQLREPYFPLHAAAELNTTIDWPKQYERAKPK